MGSKVIVFLGLFFAMVLLISSEVAAREMAENSNSDDTSSNEAEMTDGRGGGYGGYPGGGYPGRGGGGYHGGGGHGGGGYPGGGGHGGGGYPGRGGHGGGGGGHCRYGCCGRSYYKGGCRCCTYAGEKPDAEPQAEPQN